MISLVPVCTGKGHTLAGRMVTDIVLYLDSSPGSVDYEPCGDKSRDSHLRIQTSVRTTVISVWINVE
jgi:hypothetical protein